MRRCSIPSLLVVPAAAVLVLSGSAGQASDAASSKQIGPIVTVASGSDWSLKAWRSTNGLCIAHRPGGGDTCHVQLPRRGSLFAYLRGLGKHTLVIGAVARNVVRVQAKEQDRTFSIRIYEPPRTLKTRLRFFRVLVRTGSPPKWRVLAYDAEGKQVGFVGQGKPT